MTRKALLAGCLCALVALPANASASGPSNSDRALAHLINRFRVAHGLHPLRLSPRLSGSASRYSRHLMRADRFAHAARIQASGRWHVLGEVLAFKHGWRVNTRWPIGAWKRSPGHRSVLLDPRFRSVGVGRARGRFGSQRATIWTAQLGRQ